MAKDKKNWLSTKESPHVYGNWKMLSPSGVLMSILGSDRAEWYLKRNLAEVVAEKTIRLKFTPKGLGNSGTPTSEFYLTEKENVCVVCRTTEKLTKHHVVPYQYRKHLPMTYKSWTSHDILIVCVKHHEEYELEAAKKVTEIGKSKELIEFSAPTEEELSINKELKHTLSIKLEAKKSAVALIMNHSIPERRKAELTKIIENFLGHEPTYDDIINLSKLEVSHKSKDHGALVAKYLIKNNLLDDFIVNWRKHFVEVMNPQYLPQGWKVDNPTKVQKP